MPLESLRPLIVPSAYFASGEFLAPHIRLAAPDLALTCVLLDNDQTMLYVQPPLAESWEEAGIDWREAALAEMRRADEGLLWTHEKRDETNRLIWIGFMNADGLGSSRLLLKDELERQFPEGYYVALPDRSCGIAISRNTAWDGLGELRTMVADMYRDATIPMCPDIRDPEVLSLRAA